MGQSGAAAFATFGRMTGDACVDDDFSQVIFLAIPISFSDTVYVRLYDPDCGGLLDRKNGTWETNSIFELFAGKGCISQIDARGEDPHGNYRSGTSLRRSIFGPESLLDSKWSCWTSLLAAQGEQLEEFPGFSFFKIVVEGRTGNDGNIYALSISSAPDRNNPIEGADHFQYESIIVQDGALQRVVASNVLSAAEEITLPIALALPETNSRKATGSDTTGSDNTSPDLNISIEPIED